MRRRMMKSWQQHLSKRRPRPLSPALAPTAWPQEQEQKQNQEHDRGQEEERDEGQGQENGQGQGQKKGQCQGQEQEQDQDEGEGKGQEQHEHDDDHDDGGREMGQFNVEAILSSSDCNNNDESSDTFPRGLPCKSSDEMMMMMKTKKKKKVPLSSLKMMMVQAAASSSSSSAAAAAAAAAAGGGSASSSIHINVNVEQQQQQQQLRNEWASESNNMNENPPPLSFRAWIQQPSQHHAAAAAHADDAAADHDDRDDEAAAKLVNADEVHDPPHQRRKLGHIISVTRSNSSIISRQRYNNPHTKRANHVVNSERFTYGHGEGPHDESIPLRRTTPTPKNDGPHGSSRSNNLMMKPNYMIPTKSAEAKAVRSNECVILITKSKGGIMAPPPTNDNIINNNNSGRFKYSRQRHDSSPPIMGYSNNIVNELSASFDYSRRTSPAAAFAHRRPSHTSSRTLIINHRLPNNMPLFRSYNEGAGRPLQHRRPFYV